MQTEVNRNDKFKRKLHKMKQAAKRRRKRGHRTDKKLPKSTPGHFRFHLTLYTKWYQESPTLKLIHDQIWSGTSCLGRNIADVTGTELSLAICTKVQLNMATNLMFRPKYCSGY